MKVTCLNCKNYILTGCKFKKTCIFFKPEEYIPINERPYYEGSVYEVYRKFIHYGEKGEEVIKTKINGVFTRETAEHIAYLKNICSDINVMCDEYIVEKIKVIDNKDDLFESFSELEKITLRNEGIKI